MKSCLAASIIGTCFGQDVFLANPARTVSKADLVRAKSSKQGGRLGGSSPTEIADKINGHIVKLGLPTKECSDYTLTELNNLVRDMFPHLNQDLNDIYGSVSDPRTKRFSTLAEYEKHWEEDAEHAVDVIRDAKCAEAVMLWAHHLSEGGKQAFKKEIKKEIPTLPVYDAEKASSKTYESSFTCVTGHSMSADHTSDHVWPHWPEDLHYTAKGHGAYPFWSGGGSDDGTADLEVWWSERLQSEKFYHSTCTQPYLGTGVPCTHLLVGGQPDPKGYLYTDSKCCTTEPGSSIFGPSEKLAASQSDFMDDFTYQGEVDFSGVHYEGKAKYYLMKLPSSEAVQDFWYFTDMNDMPVQQGEGGTGPTDQGYPESRGHTIWHDYDQSSFKTDPIDESIFAIPDICQSTSKSCAFP